MNSDLLISVLSLGFSVIAIVASAILAIGQSKLTRHGNLLPVVIDIFKEFRDPEFKEHLNFLQHRLWQECPPSSTGTTDLPADARVHVMAVTGFFNTLGLLVADGVVDEVIPASAMGGSILRAWSRISPYINNERQRRNDPNYMMYFEDLARRALDLPPSRLRTELRVRSMPEQWFFEGWEGHPPETVAVRFASALPGNAVRRGESDPDPLGKTGPWQASDPELR